MSRRFLVTGADGFVGVHVVDHLLAQGHEVVCLLHGDGRRLPSVLAKHLGGQVSVVRHDLTTPITPTVAALLGRIDVVVSAAASTDIAGSLTDPMRVFRQNVDIVGNLTEWARRQDDLEAFVQISSEEVYGPAPAAAHREWEPIRPSTHYSASKAAQEAYLIASWRAHGLPLLILNCMNMIGPMQEPAKLVPTILRKVLASEIVPLIVDYYEPQSGSGQESLRQYMHPRVLADAIVATLHTAVRFTPKAILPARFNVAGSQVGNVALAQMVAKAAAAPLHWKPIAADHARPGHERVFALDDSLIRELGWSPPTSLEEDVHDTVAWYMEHPEWL